MAGLSKTSEGEDRRRRERDNLFLDLGSSRKYTKETDGNGVIGLLLVVVPLLLFMPGSEGLTHTDANSGVRSVVAVADVGKENWWLCGRKVSVNNQRKVQYQANVM